MKLGSKEFPWVSAGIFTGIVLVALGWSAYANQVWEDFFITYRASKNLALGNGLVYTVGDRLQTFTSPIQALVPATLAWITRCRSDELVIWIYRAMGACALGGTGVILWRMSRLCLWGAAATAACVGLFAFDAKSLGFTASGMETPYLLLFVAWQTYIVVTGGGALALGMAWAGMMYSRPDAFIQVAAFHAALLVFAPGRDSRRALLARAARAGMVTTALYLPWFVWSYVYYGTPIPNTVVAKGLDSASGFWPILRVIADAPMKIVVNGDFLRNLFAPTHADWGGPGEWGLASNCLWRLLALPVWFYWANPWGGRWARTLSLWLCLGSVYYICVPKFPWYLPPYTLVAAMAWGFVVSDVVDAIGAGRAAAGPPAPASPRLLMLCAAVLVVGFQARTCLLMAERERLQENIIEERNRRSIGVWLRHNADPGDTVFLEPIGYIGYFSNLRLFDFPGLVSREMVAARRKLRTNDYDALIRELNPVWLVLRPAEVTDILASSPGMLTVHDAGTYRLVRTYDQSAAIRALGDLCGVSTLRYDQTFLVFRRSP
jgi:hypothetical protein